MPQHQSAIKRVRQNEKRRLRNKDQKSRVRTLMKKIRATDDKAEAQELLNEAKAGLDRLASKNIIHKNKAANYKSKLEKRVNEL
jgi:small subunit ribosomal protein S20